MNTRLAKIKDKEQILKLFDEFSVLLGSKDVPSKVGEAILDEVLSRNDTMIFVAEEDNRLIGLMSFYILPNIRHGRKRGHIEDTFVTSNARKRGVGRALFLTVKDHCIKNNIKVIKLASGNELKNAHKFYEANGGKTSERFFRFDF